MAAGAYKGLTIRIGADTTKLSTALRSANSAIYKTQSELNKLSNALKIDPGNALAIDLKLKRASEQALNLAEQIKRTSEAIDKLGAKKMLDANGKEMTQTIAQLAESSDDVALKAEDWREKYTQVNGELEKIYRTIKKDTEGVYDLSKATRDGEFDSVFESFKETIARPGTPYGEMAARIEELKKKWGEARYSMENYQAAFEYNKQSDNLALLQAKIKQVSQEYANIAAKSDISKVLQPTKDKLDLLSRAGETASDRFRRLNEAAKVNPSSFGTLVDRSKALSEALRNTYDRAKNLKEQLAAYKADGIDKVAAATKDSALAFEQAKEKVANIKSALELARQKFGESSASAQILGEKLKFALSDLKTASAVEEYNKLKVELREVQAESKGMRASLVSDLGGVGAAAVQAAIEVGNMMKQVGSKIVDASNEIDSAYRDLRKTFEANSEEQYQQLYDAAMQYSQVNVTSADKMLEMESIAAQLGVGLNDLGEAYAGSAADIQHFAESAANLDVATDIDAETIALQMGQIVNVMDDLDPENVHQFADALVNLGNKMPAQESTIMQIAQRLSSIGDVAGFSTPEILSWAAAAASTGQKAEAAASGLSTLITRLSKAVGSGGDDLKTFAEVAGMTADEFKKKWTDTDGGASEALHAFIEGLGELDEAGFQKLEDLEMSGVRVTQTLMSLASTVENVDRAQKVANEGWNEGGQAALEASRKAEGFSGSLAKMKNSAQVLASTLGDSLKPFIDEAAEAMQGLTEFINGLDDSTKDAVVMWGIFAAAFATGFPIISAFLSPTLKLFGLLKGAALNALAGVAAYLKTVAAGGTAIPMFVQNAIIDLGVAAESITGAFSVLGGVFATLATSGALIPAVFGGIAAVVGGAYVARFLDAGKRTLEFKSAIDGVNDSTDGLHRDLLLGKDVVSDYGGAYKDAMEDYNEFIENLQKHNKNIKQSRDEATENIGMIEEYKRVIEEALGAGNSYDGSYAELQWALDNLNEALGTSYEMSDILKGSYSDEAGQVHNLRDEINKLVEAKEREIQLNAMQDIYTESLKAYKEAEIEYAQAGKAYEDAITEYIEKARATGRDRTYRNGYEEILSDAELEAIARGTNEISDLADAYYNAGVAVKETGERLGIVKDEWEGLYRGNYATSAGMGEREGIMRTSEAFRDAAQAIGMTDEEFTKFAKTFALRMQECGISTDEFANADLGALAKRMQETGGDVNDLLTMMLEYASLEFPDKYANVYLDEDGNFRSKVDDLVVTWDEASQSFVPVELDADTTQLELAEEQARKAVEEGEPYHVPVEADAEQLEESTQEAAANASESAEVEVDASVNGDQVADEVSAATEEASEGATVETVITVTSDASVETLKELDGKSINVALNVTANTEGTQEVLDSLKSIPESKDVAINVSYKGVNTAAKHIASLNKAVDAMTTVSKTYKVSGNATTTTPASRIERLNKAVSAMSSRNATYTAYGNIVSSDTTANRVWNLVNATNNLRSKSITLTTNDVTYKSTVQKATGTYIDPSHMPRHAAGIFTRPTLTNIGWVGEDGAELYSGNSLVPLTNRKYSMPYINDISDAVARKMGGAGKTTTINLSVSCEGGPEDTANAIVRALRLYDL